MPRNGYFLLCALLWQSIGPEGAAARRANRVKAL
jgi:hypothetical protein